MHFNFVGNPASSSIGIEHLDFEHPCYWDTTNPRGKSIPEIVEHLSAIEGVKGVVVGGNATWIRKEPGVEWPQIVPTVIDHLSDFSKKRQRNNGLALVA